MGSAERVASLVLVIFGLGVAYYAHQHLKLGHMITPGAGFLPFWVGVALALLGAIWFAITLLAATAPPAAGAAPAPDSPARVAAPGRSPVLTRLLPGVVLILAYAWLFEMAGYFLSTVLFMVAWQKGVEREGWTKTLVVSVVCAVAMYALFSFLLKGVLPKGTWFS